MDTKVDFAKKPKYLKLFFKTLAQELSLVSDVTQ